MYTYLMIHPFRDDVENLVDLRDARKSSDSNYAMVMRAAKHPTWLNKIVPMQQNTGTLPIVA